MNIQVYATKASIDAERDSMNVYLEDVDMSLLVGQISVRDLLDELELGQIQDYITEKLKEDE